MKVADASQAEMYYIMYYHICDEHLAVYQECVDNRTTTPSTVKVWPAMHDRGPCLYFAWSVGM